MDLTYGDRYRLNNIHIKSIAHNILTIEIGGAVWSLALEQADPGEGGRAT